MSIPICFPGFAEGEPMEGCTFHPVFRLTEQISQQYMNFERHLRYRQMVSEWSAKPQDGLFIAGETFDECH